MQERGRRENLRESLAQREGLSSVSLSERLCMQGVDGVKVKKICEGGGFSTRSPSLALPPEEV